MAQNLKIYAIDTESQVNKYPFIGPDGKWSWVDGANNEVLVLPENIYTYDPSIPSDDAYNKRYKTAASLTTALAAGAGHRMVLLAADLTLSADTSWGNSTGGLVVRSASPDLSTTEPVRKLILSGNITLKGVTRISAITVEASYNSTSPTPCFMPPALSTARTLYIEDGAVIHNAAKPLWGGADLTSGNLNIEVTDAVVDLLSIDAIHSITPYSGVLTSVITLSRLAVIGGFGFTKRTTSSQLLTLKYGAAVDLTNILSAWTSVDASSKTLLPSSFARNIEYQNSYTRPYFDELDDKNIESVINATYERILTEKTLSSSLIKPPVSLRSTIRDQDHSSTTAYPDRHRIVIENEEWVYFRDGALSDNDDYIIKPTLPLTGAGNYVRKSAKISEIEKLSLITATFTAAKDTKLSAIQFVGFSRGLASARPANSSANDLNWYFSTDTLVLSASISGAWVDIADISSGGGGSVTLISRSESAYKKQENIYDQFPAAGVITISDPLCTSIEEVYVNGRLTDPAEYNKTSVAPFTVTFIDANNENGLSSVYDKDHVTIRFNWDLVTTVVTTNNTTTNLSTLPLASNTAFIWEVMVGTSTASKAETGAWKFTAAFERQASGNIALLGSVTTTLSAARSAGTLPTCSMDADVISQSARIRITGENSKSYTWKLLDSKVKAI